ncbi:PRC and DUF2382 domain-containing protein [Corynebacterium cystitidis]|uniref:Conserved domain-containing protein n=1 Tax=Corynebacterium cystitidis DSM 20524 TaxID=1121357 RepID=A0A1H9V2U7_9CORY|nr:PRC and DUF2382 domain-containing protein [Corynebacterium cystitidis]WJY83368.1 PRC-barrel domain protein [Corynebacterium cystitidis DSM 20524]SES16150.1 conserved domain-containing protein [Corynebacterium cystitidis DSM 20524]SNV62582.1 Uncharacterized protein conserved in bacteria [Corynebacterium cystitidis]
MSTPSSIEQLTNATVYDANGDKLGAISDVFVNDASGRPDFIEVNHGLFGMNSSIVPLAGHFLDGTDLTVPFTKDRIQDAPHIDDPSALTDDDKVAFFRHYGLTNLGETTDRPARETEDRGHATERSTLIRSEERLHVDTQRYPTERVVLRKYIVEETQNIEVTVRREEVRVEREPITDSSGYISAVDRAELDDDARRQLDDGAASLVLFEERVRVEKDLVPVERVTLRKEVVRDTTTVTEDVAKERIDTDGEEHVTR